MDVPSKKIVASRDRHNAKQSTSSTSTLIGLDELRPYDILCGRFKNAFNHVGNRRFRVTINLNLQRYIQAEKKQEKTTLIIELVRILKQDVGVRFLKKKGPGYIELSEKQAREKVGHALRDMAVAQQQSTMKELQERRKRLKELEPLKFCDPIDHSAIVETSTTTKLLDASLFSFGDDDCSRSSASESTSYSLDAWALEPLDLKDLAHIFNT